MPLPDSTDTSNVSSPEPIITLPGHNDQVDHFLMPSPGLCSACDEIRYAMNDPGAARTEIKAELGIKATNPKDAVGSDKLPLHLVSPAFIAFTSIGKLNGMLKYGRNNWREAGVRFTIYYDALMRHAMELLDGEFHDPDDMVPHLCAMGACLDIIIDAYVTGQLVDDRNYTTKENVVGMRRAVEMLTPYVKQLKEHHAGKDPKHWTYQDTLEEHS